MNTLEVKYNGIEITPTPLVSRGYQFVDYGARWGQFEQIDLSCYITGIGPSYTTSLGAINSIFYPQFKTLVVNESNVGEIYRWENVALQEIEIPQNHFSIGTFTRYTAKLISYQIPSGVLEPVNEYSFTQGEDGIVTVNHKISAKGIRTDQTPIDNAINFVSAFVRKNPYNNCAPYFIPNSSGVLLSISEQLDRTTASYSVTEIYKYVTGQPNVGYLKTSSVSVNDSNANDYLNIDLTVTLQGSPVDKNHNELQTAAQSIDLLSVLQEYGYSTTNVYREGFTASYDSGAVRIELKGSFISGVDTDLSGFFDYSVGFDRELVPNLTTWKIDGDYITRGPLNIRKSKIATFKSANQANGFIPYLSGLLTSSALYSGYGNAYPLNIIQVTEVEDTGHATLKLSATFSDYDNYSIYVQPKYNIEVEPSRWIYEMIPAANIEGHYIVQDLQMMNATKLKATFNAIVTGESTLNYISAANLLSGISGLYLGSGAFMTVETVNSGISNITIEQNYIGPEKMSTGFLTTKAYGGYAIDYVRNAGYKFGY
jgi:hypothetical protein